VQRGLTRRSSGRAGTELLLGGRQRGAPLNLYVRAQFAGSKIVRRQTLLEVRLRGVPRRCRAAAPVDRLPRHIGFGQGHTDHFGAPTARIVSRVSPWPRAMRGSVKVPRGGAPVASGRVTTRTRRAVAMCRLSIADREPSAQHPAMHVSRPNLAVNRTALGAASPASAAGYLSR
jgi:hypothetical protein